MNRPLKDLRRVFDEIRKKNEPRPGQKAALGQYPYTMPEKKTVQDIMKALRVRN